MLAGVSKAEVAGEIQPDIARRHDDFARGSDCRRVYWRGSHHDRLQALVDVIRAHPRQA